MVRTAAALALLFAACSSPSKSGGNPTGSSTTTGGTGCAPQVGAYRLHFVDGPAGTCGALTDTIVALNTEAGTGAYAIPAGCTGKDILSSNDCSETIQLSCLLWNGNTQVTGGVIVYTADASGGTGVLQIEVRLPDGKIVCDSVYDVTVTKV